MKEIDEALNSVPIVAILRGLTPDRALDVANVLIESGIRLIEVPLNSPTPFESIRKMCTTLEGKAIFGAGTVLRMEDVDKLVDVGAKLVVSPHTDPEIIAYSLQKDMYPIPGFYTPTEAITALKSGATYLKFFPADQKLFAATRAILPKRAKVIAVGGIHPETVGMWSGVVGFGVGSALFRPSDSLDEIQMKTSRFVASIEGFQR